MIKCNVKKEQIRNQSHATELFGEHGRGYNKSIMAKITFYPAKVEYLVIDHRQIKLATDDLDKAIEVYNEI